MPRVIHFGNSKAKLIVGLRQTLLATTIAGVALLAQGSAVVAQQRTQVGQVPDANGAVQSALKQGGAVPQTMPTLASETKFGDPALTARQKERDAVAAPGQVVNPRTRAIVRKQIRLQRGVMKAPNRAVVVPQMQTVPITGGGMAASRPEGLMPQMIGPGLTDPGPAKKKKARPEEDPYAPLGLRLGTMTINSGVDLTAGYDNNPLRTTPQRGPKGSANYQVAPDVMMSSDWARHALSLTMRGSYSLYPDVTGASRPTFDGKMTFRGDIADNSLLNLELREKVDTQRPGSIDLANTVKGRPAFFTSGGSAGWTQRFGYAALTATGTVDRSDYQDGTTVLGKAVSQQDRNRTVYGAKLRGSYDLTPGMVNAAANTPSGVTPFVEVGYDTSQYDQALDRSGYARSSNGMTVKAGTTLELTRTLVGEVSAGWGLRKYDDTRLQDMSGLLLDASLHWQISPLTKAILKAGTEFAETTQVGSSGALTHRASLEISHDLLRNLTITGTAGLAKSTYQGINYDENMLNAGAKLDYKINRNIVWRSSYAYERLISSTAGQSYLSHSFLTGVRLQQ